MNYNTELFQDSIFVANYIKYVEMYSDSFWYKQVLTLMIDEFRKLNFESSLDCDSTRYVSWLAENAREIRKELKDLKTWTASPSAFKIKYPKYVMHDPKFYLNAMLKFRYRDNEGKVELQNFFNQPVVIHLSEMGENSIVDTLAAYVPLRSNSKSYQVSELPSIKCFIEDTVLMMN